MKSAISLLLAVMLVAALISGCGSQSVKTFDPKTGTSAASESNASNTEPSAMPTEPIEFSVYLGANSTNNWDTPDVGSHKVWY